MGGMMSLFTWNDDLCVGVEEIDNQHRKLVQLINGLHNHMLAGDAREIMGKVLDRVIEYTGFHFATEEHLMKEHGYPLAAAHLHEHEKLVATATDLQTRLNSGHALITAETMIFLKEWLYHHIMESDKLLGKHLNSKGVV
jgi:hemerythrin